MKLKGNSVELTYKKLEEAEKVISYLRSKNEVLNQDFNTAISIIVEMLPKEVSNILTSYRYISSEEEYFKWERKVKDELIEVAYQTVKDINFYEYPVKAFCPLCEDGLIRKPKNLAEGRTLEGIERHLEGRERHNKCKIFELLEKNVLANIKKKQQIK